MQYAHDENGNLLSTHYADGTLESYTYDGRGNRLTWTNRRGETIEYTYNDAGRLTSKIYPDASQIDYTYDTRGNLTSLVDASGTTTFLYDTKDYLTRITYPDAQWLEFTYDTGDRRASTHDSFGQEVHYHYDAVGRLDQLTDGAGAMIVAYTYDATGRLEHKGLGSGGYTTYHYDPDGQILDLINYAPDDSQLSRFQYGYDPLGQRTSMTTLDGQWTYEYDYLGQLIHAAFVSSNPEIPDQDFSFVYDALGNRIRTTAGGEVVGYTTNNMNQYTVVGDTTYEYDPDGNLVQEVSTQGTMTYTYDIENRLVGVATDTDTWQYIYNPFGHRVAEIHNGVRTNYLLDPTGFGNVVAEYDASAALSSGYVHGGSGLLVQRDASGSTHYYTFDALGNTSELTDASGTPLNRYAFDPFGQTLLASETVPNDFEFVGEWGIMATEHGDHFMRARYYDATLGRFSAQDPLRLKGGDVNLYRYVRNNSVNLIDPTGTETWEICYLRVERMPMDCDQCRTLLDYLDAEGEACVGGGPNNRDLVAGGIAFYLKVWPPPPAGLCDLWIFDEVCEEYPWDPDEPPCPPDTPGCESSNPPSTESEMAGLVVASSSENGNDECDDDDDSNNPTAPQDPNQKLGPAGFGEQNYVTPNGLLAYRVDFENDPTAGAPAQYVTVTDQLADTVDWSTFELTGIGFGDRLLTVPAGTQNYETVVSIEQNDQDLEVHVYVGIDVDTGRLTARFMTLDAETGLPPDVTTGFLPPEDGTGRGLGFFTYIIEQEPDLPTGTEIRNIAVIQFDFGEIIATNQVDPHDPSQGTDPAKEALVTIDAGPPDSHVSPLPAEVSDAAFTVEWSGQDDLGGSGIASFDVYVSNNGAAFQLWQHETVTNSATFSGQPGHSYAFYSVATDNVGHRELPPSSPDATTTILLSPGITVTPTTELVTTEDGGTAEFTVVLDTQPSEPVTIAVASGDDTEGTVSVSSLTFTPDDWGTSQTVTITGVDDPDVDGDVQYTILLGPVTGDPVYAAIDPDDLTVTNTDNDVTTVLVVEIEVPAPPAHWIGVVFSEPMAIPPMISDGSISPAVSLVSLGTGPVSMTSDQFSYEEATRTLTWSTTEALPPGFYEIQLEGGMFADTAGNLLRGGSGGLVFNVQSFDSEQTVQAGGAGIDVGTYSVPALADWNSDGRTDLIVGEKTTAGHGKVRVYPNVGTAAAPAYASFVYARLVDNNHVTVPADGCLGAFPRVFDWDGDGRNDLVIGRADGKVQWFRNMTNNVDPRFEVAGFVQVGAPGAKVDLDVGDRATLEIVDWNNDGRYDLLAGALDGRVRLYLNEAALGPADFRSEARILDDSAELDVPTGRSSVAAADLDGDGRKDLLVGNTEGQLLFYRNIGFDSDPAFDGWELTEAGGTPVDLPEAPRSRPFLGHFNADGTLDILVGSEDGLVRLYVGEAQEPIDGGLYIVAGATGGLFSYVLNVSSATPWIVVDDGDANFSETPPASFKVSNLYGAFGDHRVSYADAGNTATWTCLGLDEGQYAVSATWIQHFNRASNARFTLDGGSGGTTVVVSANQRSKPNDFPDHGVWWENLDVVQVGSQGTLTVTLTDAGANGIVVADAVRVEKAPEIEVNEGGTGLMDGVGTVDFGTTELCDFVTKTITVRNTGAARLNLGALQVIGERFHLASPLGSTSLAPLASATFDIKFDARRYGTWTGSVSIASNDFDENPFNFNLTGTVAPFRPQIIDDGGAGYVPGDFIPGPKREGYGGDVDYQLANRSGAAAWTFSGLDSGTYQLAATWSPAYNRATNARYQIGSQAPVTVNQRAHPTDFMANGARWEILGQAAVATSGGSITVSLSAGTNGIVIADAVRIVPVSNRVLYRPGEFAVVDNGDPGFGGDSNGVSTWETVGRTSFDGEYAYLNGDNNGNIATWSFTVVPGTYRVGLTWQWAPYNRATNATYTINGGAPITLNQMMPPSDDQLGQGVVDVNGTDFQVLTESVEVLSGSDSIQVGVTDTADSYVTLDAVMVQVLSVTAAPSPFPLTAAVSADVLAPKQTDQNAPLAASEAVATGERARDEVFARVEGWIEFKLDHLLDGSSDEDASEADEYANLWWALYWQE
jgi:RHS repeat-associated protein